MAALLDSEKLKRLSIDERLAMVDQICETIEEDSFAISPALRRELERRLKEVDAHPDEGSPWEEVEARILNRLNNSTSSSASRGEGNRSSRRTVRRGKGRARKRLR